MYTIYTHIYTKRKRNVKGPLLLSTSLLKYLIARLPASPGALSALLRKKRHHPNRESFFPWNRKRFLLFSGHSGLITVHKAQRWAVITVAFPFSCHTIYSSI